MSELTSFDRTLLVAIASCVVVIAGAVIAHHVQRRRARRELRAMLYRSVAGSGR